MHFPFPFPYNLLTPPPLPPSPYPPIISPYSEEHRAWQKLLAMDFRLNDMIAKIDLFVLNKANT